MITGRAGGAKTENDFVFRRFFYATCQFWSPVLLIKEIHSLNNVHKRQSLNDQFPCKTRLLKCVSSLFISFPFLKVAWQVLELTSCSLLGRSPSFDIAVKSLNTVLPVLTDRAHLTTLKPLWWQWQ